MRHSEVKRRKDILGLKIIAVVFFLALLPLVYTWHKSRMPKADIFNCIGEVTRKTAIVLDQTDPVSRQTKDEIRSRVMHHV